MTDSKLTDLRGVGPRTARQLEAAGFGAVDLIALADLELLEKIPGVGQVRARALKREAERFIAADALLARSEGTAVAVQPGQVEAIDNGSAKKKREKKERGTKGKKKKKKKKEKKKDGERAKRDRKKKGKSRDEEARRERKKKKKKKKKEKRKEKKSK
jgi:Holliday junction resolvasome RuvABC DNA-binding subunit